MRAKVLFLTVSLVAAPLTVSAAWRRDRLIVLVGGRGDAAAKTQVGAEISGVLADKNYEVVPATDVEEFLADEDTSPGKPIPSHVRKRLAKRFRAQVLVAVEVGFLLDQRARPKGPTASPAMGLTATLASAEDQFLWRSSLGIVGDEVAAADKDARPKMIRRLCEQLLWAMPRGTPNPETQVVRKVGPPAVYRPPTNVPPRYDAISERVPDLRSGPKFRLLVGRRAEETGEGPDGGAAPSPPGESFALHGMPDGGSR